MCLETPIYLSRQASLPGDDQIYTDEQPI